MYLCKRAALGTRSTDVPAIYPDLNRPPIQSKASDSISRVRCKAVINCEEHGREASTKRCAVDCFCYCPSVARNLECSAGDSDGRSQLRTIVQSLKLDY